MENMKKIKDKKSVAIKNALYENASTNHPAFKMVENGDIEKLKELSLEGIINEEVDNLGNTLLHKAVRSENMEMIKIVLKMNIDVNAKNNMGETPLHVAAKFNNVLAIKELLQHKADVNVTDNNKLTPLHVAAAHSDVDGLRLLMAHGAAIEARDKWGTTPLFRASSAANVSELIHTGKANVNDQDILGNTPLFYAAWRNAGNGEVVGMLCFYGADPMMKNYRGFSALDIAREEKHPELVEKMQHYIVMDTLKSLAAQIEQKAKNIQEILKDTYVSQTANNDLKYNMTRSLIRLKTVELFLKRADYQEQLRKSITEPQVIAAQKTTDTLYTGKVNTTTCKQLNKKNVRTNSQLVTGQKTIELPNNERSREN